MYYILVFMHYITHAWNEPSHRGYAIQNTH